MKTRASPLDVVEAGYDLTCSEDAWIGRLADAIQPHLDVGLGVTAFTCDLARSAELLSTAVRGVEPGLFDAMNRFHGSNARTMFAAMKAPRSVMTLSGFIGRTRLRSMCGFEWIDACGNRDMLAVKAVDPETMRLVSLGAPQRNFGGVPRRLVATWTRVAAHLAQALRARQRLARAGQASALAGAEAVLSPTGRIEHAEGAAQSLAARSALREAALRVDRARGPLRHRDSELALDLWQGLAAGRWSLVDHFDSDGRRYVVARENAPALPSPVAIDERARRVLAYRAQGHPLKLIAYELGLSISTVSAALSRARSVLGLHDTDLPGLFRSTGGPSTAGAA